MLIDNIMWQVSKMIDDRYLGGYLGLKRGEIGNFSMLGNSDFTRENRVETRCEYIIVSLSRKHLSREQWKIDILESLICAMNIAKQEEPDNRKLVDYYTRAEEQIIPKLVELRAIDKEDELKRCKNKFIAFQQALHRISDVPFYESDKAAIESTKNLFTTIERRTLEYLEENYKYK